MRTARRLPSILALSALALVLGGLSLGEARAADPAPEHPFLDLVKDLHVGSILRTRGVIVAALEVAPSRQVQVHAEPGLRVQVGLAGAATDILPLPGPAGLWHVRVTNKGKTPLLIPAGETLVTPTQPSRSTDRPVWIAPGAATFVPVVQRQMQGEPPQGPYLSRGRGLTPVELSLIASDRWAQRVRARNAQMGVVGTRLDDAAAAYARDAFATVLERYRARLDSLVKGRSVVGVIAADRRGIHYAHFVANHELFLASWPALRDGLVLDAAMLESVGGAPRPGDEGKFRSVAGQVLGVLETPPLHRPTFGEGWEYRWNLADPTGTWDGLGLATGPVCLTLHRNPDLPAGAPSLPGTGGVPEGDTPSQMEGERRRRPTAFEERLRDRRRAMPNGPNLPPGGATTPPGNPAANPPSVPTPSPTPPAPSAPPAPGPSVPGPR